MDVHQRAEACLEAIDRAGKGGLTVGEWAELLEVIIEECEERLVAARDDLRRKI
jgi:hypothetical protein